MPQNDKKKAKSKTYVILSEAKNLSYHRTKTYAVILSNAKNPG